MNRLQVFWDCNLVGTLTRHKMGRVVFQYASHWLKHHNKPVSLSMPCRKEKFPPALSTAFFENLLPESNARNILAFNNRFNKKDTFAFLEKFGEDCAGALSVVPEEDIPEFASGMYECIDSELMETLDKIAESPQKLSLYPEMKKARLSIAGAQDKLPVYIRDGSFFLPKNAGSPTTHIIKPVNADFPGLPRNEAFCMDLARNAGLTVPNSILMTIGIHELFVIERYDRKTASKNVLRLHQEDFCQAMGYPADRKYQGTGGPGFLQCRELIDEYLSDSGVRSRLQFIKTAVFNYLIGNHDAHGKNFSLLHEPELKFAPAYDLVSTQVYPSLDNKFAMAFGQTYRMDRIDVKSFDLFAKQVNVRPSKLSNIINEVTEPVSRQLIPLLEKHVTDHGAAHIYDNLHDVINKNIKRLIRFSGL